MVNLEEFMKFQNYHFKFKLIKEQLIRRLAEFLPKIYKTMSNFDIFQFCSLQFDSFKYNTIYSFVQVYEESTRKTVDHMFIIMEDIDGYYLIDPELCVNKLYRFNSLNNCFLWTLSTLTHDNFKHKNNSLIYYASQIRATNYNSDINYDQLMIDFMLEDREIGCERVYIRNLRGKLL